MYKRQTFHRARTGVTPQGSGVVGLILVATALLSTLIVAGLPPAARATHVLSALGWGAIAWLLADVAQFVKAAGGEPGWVASFATAGSQVVVLAAFARALLLSAAYGGGSFAAIRPTIAVLFLLGLALATPALAAAARALVAAEPTPRERTADAEATRAP